MHTTERVGQGVASARAALAGNPSDGYGGAVIAVTLDEFQARATARAASEPGASPDSELVAVDNLLRVFQKIGQNAITGRGRIAHWDERRAQVAQLTKGGNQSDDLGSEVVVQEPIGEVGQQCDQLGSQFFRAIVRL